MAKDAKGLREWAAEEEKEHEDKGGGGGEGDEYEEGEGEGGGEEEQADAEETLERLIDIINENLEAIEGSIDELPGEILSDPEAEMDDAANENIVAVLDGADPMLREALRGIAWDAAQELGSRIDEASDQAILGGWLFRAGQVA